MLMIDTNIKTVFVCDVGITIFETVHSFVGLRGSEPSKQLESLRPLNLSISYAKSVQIN